MNSRARWREVLRVTRREEVTRWEAPPDWDEWGWCADCGARLGQPCTDALGSTAAVRFTSRMNPHEGRLPKGAMPDE